ncbi:MAG: OmpA family protein, partial [Chitinophagales bacterium]|nr:OmpA family protein [Chitinophagales bacterium]
RSIKVTGKAEDDFGNVYFGLNSNKVEREFFKTIHDVASYLEKNPSAKIELGGHTDVRGSEQSNLRLGMRRAESVAKVLKSQFGIPESRIVVNSYGEEKAMVPNLPESYNPQYEGGHYLNRRVEFKVIK